MPNNPNSHAVAICLIALVLLALNMQGIPAGSATSDNQAPIKIGFLTSLSGVASPGGHDELNGMKLFLEEAHNQIAGRKVELVVENDESSPATAVAKLKKLVETDKVDVVAGLVLSNIGYPLAAFVDRYQIPMIYVLPAADDLTKRKRDKWVIRTSYAASQITMPFGEWVRKTLGYKRVTIFGLDYPLGWETAAGFQRTFEEAGGKIVQKIWAPLGFRDFSDSLKQIRTKDTDAIFMATANQPAEIIPLQCKQVGITLPIIAIGPALDEDVLRKLGDEAIGIISPLNYSASLNTPTNQKFVKAYRSKYGGQDPSQFAEHAFVAGLWISKGIEGLKGNVADHEKLLEALRHVELKDAPRGPIKLDDYGNPIQNVYIRKVERVNGRLQNIPIYTFKNVSQFWKYDPSEFLKQPPFSKDYPPCKNCL